MYKIVLTAELQELEFARAIRKLDRISKRLLENEIIDSNWEFERRWADLYTLESPVFIYPTQIFP